MEDCFVLWPSHNVLTLKLRQFFCLTNKQKSLLYQRILTFRLTIPIELLNRPYSLINEGSRLLFFIYSKVNSVHEACAKCLVGHILFEILQIT